MATALAFPANWEVDTVGLLPDFLWDEVTDEAGDSDPLLSVFPFSHTEHAKVRWDQWQNPWGQTGQRGLDSPPDLVTMNGLKLFEVDPGYYADETTLLESEMTLEREPGSVNDPIVVQDRLGKLVLDLATRAATRFRTIAADLLTDGTFTNTKADGTVVHHYQVDGYQTFSPANDGATGPGWAADPTNADPIGDLIYWQTNKLNKGTSAHFGQKSKILCNPTVVNDIWKCTSIRTAFKSKFGASVLRGDTDTGNLDGEQSLNTLFTGMGLPPIVSYDKGYYTSASNAASEDPANFTFAIPDKTLIWIGRRPKGQQIGAMKLTRNMATSAYGAGKYPKVDVQNEQKVELAKGIFVTAELHRLIPVYYRIQVGFNFCPILYYKRGTAGITFS